MKTASRSVLIYRSQLSHPERWILYQAAAMKRYKHYFICAETSEESGIAAEKLIQVNISDFLEDPLPFSLKPKIRFSYLLERLEQDPPSLLYAHFGPDAVEAMPIADALNLPMIVAYHGYDATRNDKSLRTSSMFLRRYLFWREKLKQRASLFLCDSGCLSVALAKQGFPGEKLRVHHIGTDLSVFKRHTDSESQPYVLFAGQLFENSGCEFLLRAMQIVQQHFPLVRLVIAGDGAQRIELTKLAQELKLNVEFIVVVNQTEMITLLQKALIFCLPSITADNGDSEGLPCTLLEAQAMGCPIVSTYHSGIPDAVLTGVTAELIEERNTVKLAEAILGLIRSDSRRALAKIEGPKFIKSHFDVLKQTQILEDYFDEVIFDWNKTNESKGEITS